MNNIIIYKVNFGSEKYQGESKEYFVRARSISEAEKVAKNICRKNKDMTQTGIYTRSVEIMCQTDN